MAYYDEYDNDLYNPDDGHDSKQPGLNANWRAIQKGFKQVEDDINSVEDRLTTAEDRLTIAEGNIEELSAAVDNLSDDVDGLENRMTTAEGSISTLQSDVNVLHTSVDGLTGRMIDAESDIGDLKSRVTTAENDIDSLESRMTTAEDTLNNHGIAINLLESTTDALAGRVSTAETDIDNLETRMGNAESDIDSLETRMGAAEDVNTQQNSRLTAIEQVNTQQTQRLQSAEGNITANANAITALNNRVTNVEEDVDELEPLKTTAVKHGVSAPNTMLDVTDVSRGERTQIAFYTPDENIRPVYIEQQAEHLKFDRGKDDADGWETVEFYKDSSTDHHIFKMLSQPTSDNFSFDFDKTQDDIATLRDDVDSKGYDIIGRARMVQWQGDGLAARGDASGNDERIFTVTVNLNEPLEQGYKYILICNVNTEMGQANFFPVFVAQPNCFTAGSNTTSMNIEVYAKNIGTSQGSLYDYYLTAHLIRIQ